MGDAALVIVDYRSADETSACIASVQQTAGDLVGEVVVVDNAPGEGAAAVLAERHPGTRVIEMDENRGFAAGVNAGVAATESPFVLVLNPDTIVRPGAVATLVEHLRGHDRVGVAGPVLLHRDGSVRAEAYKRWPSLWTLFVNACLPLGRLLQGTPLPPEVLTAGQIESGAPVARVCGSAMAIRRAAWHEAGPMDDGYFLYFEEVEWQRRVAERGWGIELVPAARVVHLVQGGEALETWPLPYLRSAFRFFEQRGHSRRTIGRVLALAIAISRVSLALTRLIPPLREKSARIDRGYRELARAAREEARLAPGQDRLSRADSASASSGGNPRTAARTPK